MKIYINMKGKVTAEAQSIEDVKYLLAADKQLTLEDGKLMIKHRRHRKHQHRKACAVCGKYFKGNKGLATHRRSCTIGRASTIWEGAHAGTSANA